MHSPSCSPLSFNICDLAAPHKRAMTCVGLAFNPWDRCRAEYLLDGSETGNECKDMAHEIGKAYSGTCL